jgi:hypothetical protein
MLPDCNLEARKQPLESVILKKSIVGVLYPGDTNDFS